MTLSALQLRDRDALVEDLVRFDQRIADPEPLTSRELRDLARTLRAAAVIVANTLHAAEHARRWHSWPGAIGRGADELYGLTRKLAPVGDRR